MEAMRVVLGLLTWLVPCVADPTELHAIVRTARDRLGGVGGPLGVEWGRVSAALAAQEVRERGDAQVPLQMPALLGFFSAVSHPFGKTGVCSQTEAWVCCMHWVVGGMSVCV